ncbi:outer membrane insertion signal domain protein [Cooperia oncophora]
MPFLHGAVVSAGLKYRFIIAVLLVYILYSQWRHNNDLFLIIEKAGNDLTLCQNYAESLVAKLRVIYDHKIKMEKLFNSKRVSSQGKRRVAERLWQLCEENLTSITAELDQCRSGKRDQIPHPDSPETMLLNRLQGKI